MPGIQQSIYIPCDISGRPGFDFANVLLADADAPVDSADTGIAPDGFYADMIECAQGINCNLMVLIVCLGVLFGAMLAQAFNFWKW